MLYLSKKIIIIDPLMLWQFFSLPGIENGIEYRYFSRYRIEVRNSSIVTTLDLREDLDEQDREIISDISDQMSTGLGHSPVCSEVGPTILFIFFLL